MDRLKEYNILNSVKPKFLRTQYPYNLVDPKKIIMTQKKITILAKTQKEKKGGAEKQTIIYFYG
jgi:hypothetical protein